jgi:Tfp pilus assembly protein PilN
MIRINLLPFKQMTLVLWGQRQVLIFVAALLTSLIVCLVWYSRRPDPDAIRKRLASERAKVERRTTEVQAEQHCDRPDLEKLIGKETQKYQDIERLLNERETPKYVLRELSRILSESWGPTLKKSLAGKEKTTLYNQNWDPTSVWITRLQEKNREIIIEGGAKGSDDVAEFWRRLQVSAYFFNAELEKFTKLQDTTSKSQYLKFSIVAKVYY